MKSVVSLVVVVLCVCVGSLGVYGSECNYRVAESVPIGLNITPTDVYTYQAFLDVINAANYSIDIACFYMTFTEGHEKWPVADGGIQGWSVFQALIRAKRERNVKIRIVQLLPSSDFPDTDSKWLADHGIAEVRSINWAKLEGNGILHTKLMISDNVNAYLGSANMDWRSLAQVKELGIVTMNCSPLALDIKKEFEIYWTAANLSQLPVHWPSSFDTTYNSTHPLNIIVNSTTQSVFIATAPPQFTTPQRTADIYALTHAMHNANKTIDIEVMDYCPCTLYNKYAVPPQPEQYWGDIDDAIRAAAFRGVKVRFLAAKWAHTYQETIEYFKSLNQLKNVEVRWFIVPDQPGQKPVPFTRVNHAKFCVTDKQSYVGTSNWSADYFINTAGMSSNWFSEPLRAKVAGAFERDWNSPYTATIQ
eukprot:TRINITY_DN4040_c0_g1_i1.p1 TRINITY_DN4040_c0_g1~~TRINITY_DN4040_c0_g1_i1.p1  ORF type:complete len:419 (-),score=89.24 TRINITY_DN4040_c0_g1_i1:52-1308(-)